MAPTTIPAELEAKLLAPGESALRAIARLAEIGPYRFEVRDTVRLHSLYLDTSELALSRQAIAFRLRRCGRRWEATLKWRGSAEGEIHERPELNVPLRGRPKMPFELTQPELYEWLAGRVAGRALDTILVTDIRRTRIDVFSRGDEPGATRLAEIALDRVRLHGGAPGGPENRYCEVEVERLDGTREDVVQIATLLRHGFGLYPSTESKFERGLALLHRPQWTGVPSSGLVIEDTVVSAARKIVGQQLEQLRLHDPGTRRGDDPEDLHDMRVAARRLRAAVEMFGGAVPARLRTSFRAELKWLRDCLGSVRDIDVQTARVGDFCASTPASLRVALESYSRFLERRRGEGRTQMLEALRSPRYFALMLRLEKFATGATPVSDDAALRPVGGLAADAVESAYRRVRKRGRKVDAEPTSEDLHALRTRAKRLRYVLEFCRDLTGREGRRAVRRLVEFQDLLGAFHDAVVAADFVRQYVESPAKRAGAAALITMGAFLGQELHRAEESRQRFGRAWKRFERRRTRRDFDAIVRKLRRESSLGEPSVRERPEPPAVIAVEAPAPALDDGPSTIEAELDRIAPDELRRGPVKRNGPASDNNPTARAAGEGDA